MPRTSSTYGGDGGLSTTIEREPIDIGQRPNFFGDLEKFRRIYKQPQRGGAGPAPVTNPFGKNNAVMAPPRMSSGMQARALSAPRRELPQEHEVYTAAEGPLAFGAITHAKPKRVAKGTPGSVFSGYSDQPYEVRLDPFGGLA